MLKPHDSLKQIIAKLTNELAISATQLAALVGVSERTLSDWKIKGPGDLPPKAARLARLAEAVDEIGKLEQGATSGKILSILNNGDVPLGSASWPDVDAIPLIQYICVFPKETGWKANVDAAVKDHKRFLTARHG
jgi:transcriptional regulator with XRE-family HTH domain